MRDRLKRPAAARSRLLDRLPAAPGLCAGCRHAELLEARRAVFVRCALARSDPRFARYPPLPVLRCAGYSSLEDATV